TPPEHTLLWAFTAYLFLHPKVNKKWSDPWDFKRYVRELWHWLGEEGFDEALGCGVESNSRANNVAASALAASPFDGLLAELRQFPTESALDAYLAQRDFSYHQEATRKLLQQLLGANGLQLYLADSLHRW